MQTFLHIFEDTKDAVIEDTLPTPRPRERTSISKDQSHPEGSRQQESLVSTSKSNKVVEGSMSEAVSYDPGLKTPPKKTTTSVQINLDIDSNSKKLERKLKFDSADDHIGLQILEPSSQRMILINIEQVVESCEDKRGMEILAGSNHRLESDAISSLKGSIIRSSFLTDDSQESGSQRFVKRFEKNKKLPQKGGGGCNPCNLI